MVNYSEIFTKVEEQSPLKLKLNPDLSKSFNNVPTLKKSTLEELQKKLNYTPNILKDIHSKNLHRIR